MLSGCAEQHSRHGQQHSNELLVHVSLSRSRSASLWLFICVSAEQDKGRAQRHHDELVISINAGKKDLREKTKERGAAADANRKAGYAALLVLHFFVLLG